MWDAEICEFINRLVSRVKNEHVFEQITEEWRRNKTKYKGRWDTPARRIFGNVLREVFRQSFPNLDDKTSVYVEGEGTPPTWIRPPQTFRLSWSIS